MIFISKAQADFKYMQKDRLMKLIDFSLETRNISIKLKNTLTDLTLARVQTVNTDKFSIYTYSYSDKVVSAKSIVISDNKNITIVIDNAKSKENIKLTSCFSLGNDSPIDERIFYDYRLVLRKNDLGLKILPVIFDTAAFPTLTVTHENNENIYQFTSKYENTTTSNIFATMCDVESHIKQWHINILSEKCFNVIFSDNTGIIVTLNSDESVTVNSI